MQAEYNYRQYFEHGMTPLDHELAYRDALNEQLPTEIIDCHVHAAQAKDFDNNNLSEYARNHMVSTFPETTMEQSVAIDALMLPHMSVRKLRFAHAFAGIDHKAVNEYLVDASPEDDKVALFGISDSPKDIEYTIEELRSGKYNALKMYYMASPTPKWDLFDYFPPPVLAEAERQGIPIILHFPKTVSQSLDELEGLTSQYPNLPVVLAHIGVTWFDSPKLDETLAYVASKEQVSVDTSGVTEQDVVMRALRHLGPKRLLYGSDEPYNILREFGFEHPELGPRILSDYPYHWVDPEEFERFHHLAPPDMAYSQLQQVNALINAVRKVSGSATKQDTALEQIFHNNAARTFGFETNRPI